MVSMLCSFGSRAIRLSVLIPSAVMLAFGTIPTVGIRRRRLRDLANPKALPSVLFTRRVRMRSQATAIFAALITAGCGQTSSAEPFAKAPFAGIDRAMLPTTPMTASKDILMPGGHTACGKSLKFVSDFNNSVVDVYTRTILCHVIFHLSNPNGIAVDSRGALYVAQRGSSNVAIVKPPYDAISGTLDDFDEDPGGVAICKGFIAVTNLQTNEGNAGSVSIYVGKAKQPTYVLQDPNALAEYSPACDHSGNLYTTYLSGSYAGGVNEWKSARGEPIELSAIVVGFPGGLRYAHGALWVGDQQTPTITVWQAPFSQMSESIYLSGSDDPVDFALDRGTRQIMVADAALNEGIIFNLKGVERATLPGNGGGLAVGIAYWP